MSYGVFADKAEYDRWMKEWGEAKAQLQDVAEKAERAYAAEVAGEAADFAKHFGVDIPPAARKALDAALFFGPVLKLLPLPEAAQTPVDVVLEALELLGRAFGVKPR